VTLRVLTIGLLLISLVKAAWGQVARPHPHQVVFALVEPPNVTKQEALTLLIGAVTAAVKIEDADVRGALLNEIITAQLTVGDLEGARVTVQHVLRSDQSGEYAVGNRNPASGN
jgi:hypothetical protein